MSLLISWMLVVIFIQWERGVSVTWFPLELSRQTTTTPLTMRSTISSTISTNFPSSTPSSRSISGHEVYQTVFVSNCDRWRSVHVLWVITAKTLFVKKGSQTVSCSCISCISFVLRTDPGIRFRLMRKWLDTMTVRSVCKHLYKEQSWSIKWLNKEMGLSSQLVNAEGHTGFSKILQWWKGIKFTPLTVWETFIILTFTDYKIRKK